MLSPSPTNSLHMQQSEGNFALLWLTVSMTALSNPTTTSVVPLYIFQVYNTYFNTFVLPPLFFPGSLINKQADHVELPSKISSEIFYPYAT